MNNNEHIKNLSGVSDKFLIECAKKVMKNSYSKYSKFKVGAALLTEDGRVFDGCNIENASFGATICAERTAVVKAISEGAKKINRIAIVSDTQKTTPPCGICLQFLKEFMDENGVIILEDGDEIYRYTFSEMYPMSFSLQDFE
jgi:cytidine deaminase